MASSPLRSKFGYHARSISLPSSSHPLIPRFNEQLCRVSMASEATTSLSLSSIPSILSGLEDLYDCVDDLLMLPHTRQAFAQQKWVDEALDGRLGLLDLCSTTKDIFSRSRQDVQQLLSVLRRRRDTNDFGGHLASRKKAKKAIQKSLKDFRGTKNKPTLAASDKDHETLVIISMLNEVETVTLAVLESLLSNIAGTKVPSRWSMVSKMMHIKRVACQEKETFSINESEMVDAELNSLIGSKTCKSDNLQSLLGKMESTMEGVEEGIECLFRRLIKTRVSLLNILNH